jgi:hypothetical protein
VPPALYPLADNVVQRFDKLYPGLVFTGLEKLLLHTTEGSGWPDYAGGASAPNLTGRPDLAAKRVDWRGHFPINMSSRALLHTRTQPTNGDHVVQVELVGTCVPGGPGLYWPSAPDWALQGVADLLAWLHTQWGMPLTSTVIWRAYNAPGESQRLTDIAYDAYRGVLGHQHAPQNDHRDPGALDVARIIKLAAGGAMPNVNLTRESLEAIAGVITGGEEALYRVHNPDQPDPKKPGNLMVITDALSEVLARLDRIEAKLDAAPARTPGA